MYALFDDERKALATIAGFAIAGALAVLPLTVAPRWTVAHAHPMRDALPSDVHAPAGRLAFPQITVARDPFVSLVPDTAAASEQKGSVAIRAVVVGDDPRALVESKGEVRVLAIGDAIGQRRIVGIDAHGVTLADGSHLPIAKERTP